MYKQLNNNLKTPKKMKTSQYYFRTTTFCFAVLVSASLISCDTDTSSSQQQPTDVDTTSQTVTAPDTTTSARPTHWSYSENGGPAKWGDLDPVYSLCAHGNHQI